MSKTGKSFFALALTMAFSLAMAPGSVFAGCVGSTTTFEFGDTVTESCTFDSNMKRSDTGATGHGLIIGADDITIDGNGYSLDGEVKSCEGGEPTQVNDAGIYFVADSLATPLLDNVTITDLEVKNFCFGIYLSGDPGSGMPATGCVVECCEVHDNGVNENDVKTGGIWQNNVFNSFIRNCKVYKNEGDPTASAPPGGFGIYLAAGNDNEWSGNEVYENRKAGMFWRGMPQGTWVHHNYAHDNNFAGIRGMCIHTSNSLVEYNYCISDDVGPGIMFGGPQVWTDLPNVVRHNVCRGNKTYGIEFSRNVINNKGECYENTACGNLGGYDIFVKTGVTIPGNCNTCDTTHNYDDESAGSGCLYACGEEPCADFSTEQTTARTITFTDLSAPGNQNDSIDSWYWDFGDCSEPSTEQNPIHVYAEEGNYMVCLSVNDDKVCPTGTSEGRRDTICKSVPAMEADYYYLDLHKFPFYHAGDSVSKYSGPAVAQMWLSYLWWNGTGCPPDLCDNTLYTSTHPDLCTQDQLFDYGAAENYGTTPAGILDIKGLWYAVQYLDPPYNPYHYNFSYRWYRRDNVEAAMNDICKWIDYAPGGHDGHPVHVPCACPTGGNYENWMAVRGIHTSEKPWGSPGYDVYGFWVNDPNPSGIGVNSYKTADEWSNGYFHKLATGDECNGTWVSILEPPEEYGEVRIAEPVERFDRQINPVMMEKPLLLDGLEEMVLIERIEEEDSLDVIKAAIDGVTEELIPYDPRFEAVFKKTVAGEPLLVKDDGKDYYLVPFNLPIRQISKEKYEIQKLDKIAREMKVVKRVDDELVIQPIPIDPIQVNEENTLVVVRIDAEDGSFKEASWVDNPVQYLPVSKEEALKLVLGQAKSKPVSRPVIELANIDSKPYYPAWQITVDGVIYYVSQDGTVTLEYEPHYSSYLTVDIDTHTCNEVATSIDPVMAGQIERYACEDYIEACAPIGPNCMPMDIAQEIVESCPTESWQIVPGPVGVVVSCP